MKTILVLSVFSIGLSLGIGWGLYALKAPVVAENPLASEAEVTAILTPDVRGKNLKAKE